MPAAAPWPEAQEEILAAALAARDERDIPAEDDSRVIVDSDGDRSAELAGLDGAELDELLAAAPSSPAVSTVRGVRADRGVLADGAGGAVRARRTGRGRSRWPLRERPGPAGGRGLAGRAGGRGLAGGAGGRGGPAVARAVLAADPDAARRQREEDVKDARVECWLARPGRHGEPGRAGSALRAHAGRR